MVTPPGLTARLRLMVITDRRLAGEGWLATVEAALSAGATAVQLRDKSSSSGELLELAEAVGRLARTYGTLFLVNDRFDVALAAGADGVHLGDDDLPIGAVRRVAPRGFVIGCSADTVSAARQAEREGASYLGVGSVFPTSTKAEVAGEAIGPARLEQVARSVAIPVVGIGGVTRANVGRIVEAGAVGAAVISAIMGVPDPESATAGLLAGLSEAREGGA